MKQIIQGIPGVQCILDDMLITGRDDTEHLRNLEKVLLVLRNRGLHLNKSKVVFCGHEIDAQGLHKTEDKIKAVKHVPWPHQLLSQILTQPLHCTTPTQLALTKKNCKWVWSTECETAFVQAKTLITFEEVLTHYDPQLLVKLACDASPYGMGAVMYVPRNARLHRAANRICFANIVIR